MGQLKKCHTTPPQGGVMGYTIRVIETQPMSYLVIIDDGEHSHSEEWDTLEEAQADFKETVEYYSKYKTDESVPPQEYVTLESDDLETLYEEHVFDYDITDESTHPQFKDD